MEIQAFEFSDKIVTLLGGGGERFSFYTLYYKTRPRGFSKAKYGRKPAPLGVARVLTFPLLALKFVLKYRTELSSYERF